MEFSAAGREEILAAIDKANPSQPVRIATLNPEFALEAQNNPEFKIAVAAMTHCVIDGYGLLAALKLWRFLKRKPDFRGLVQYKGADLAADLFSKYAFGEKNFFLLGGYPGQAAAAAHTIRQRYPSIHISAHDGGFIDKTSPQVDQSIIDEILLFKTDILLVGFGAPKQELWIRQASGQPVPVIIGVGGTFGFYSNKKRAPGLLRALHLEWLFRAFTEKGHWRRAFRAVFVFGGKSLLWIIKN